MEAKSRTVAARVPTGRRHRRTRRLLEGVNGQLVASGGGRDPCVVDAAPLSSLLHDFVATFRRNYPDDAIRELDRGPGGRLRGSTGAAPIAWLVERTRATSNDPDGQGVPESTIRNLLGGTHQVTELRVADAIVTAMNRVEAFYDGTLTIRPNRLARGGGTDCCGLPPSGLF